jgi:hypothetical protein
MICFRFGKTLAAVVPTTWTASPGSPVAAGGVRGEREGRAEKREKKKRRGGGGARQDKGGCEELKVGD